MSTITDKTKKELWKLYFGLDKGIAKCKCCGIIDIFQFHFESGHIIAKSNNGDNEIDNLVPICSLCNKSMSNMNLDIFMAKLNENILTENISKTQKIHVWNKKIGINKGSANCMECNNIIYLFDFECKYNNRNELILVCNKCVKNKNNNNNILTKDELTQIDKIKNICDKITILIQTNNIMDIIVMKFLVIIFYKLNNINENKYFKKKFIFTCACGKIIEKQNKINTTDYVFDMWSIFNEHIKECIFPNKLFIKLIPEFQELSYKYEKLMQMTKINNRGKNIPNPINFKLNKYRKYDKILKEIFGKIYGYHQSYNIDENIKNIILNTFNNYFKIITKTNNEYDVINGKREKIINKTNTSFTTHTIKYKYEKYDIEIIIEDVETINGENKMLEIYKQYGNLLYEDKDYIDKLIKDYKY